MVEIFLLAAAALGATGPDVLIQFARQREALHAGTGVSAVVDVETYLPTLGAASFRSIRAEWSCAGFDDLRERATLISDDPAFEIDYGFNGWHSKTYRAHSNTGRISAYTPQEMIFLRMFSPLGLTDYSSTGYRWEYFLQQVETGRLTLSDVGEEAVGSVPCRRVEARLPRTENRLRHVFWVNVADAHIMRIRDDFPGDEFLITEYRDVGGVAIAVSGAITQAGQEYGRIFEVRVDTASLQLGAQFTDDVFTVPFPEGAHVFNEISGKWDTDHANLSAFLREDAGRLRNRLAQAANPVASAERTKQSAVVQPMGEAKGTSCMLPYYLCSLGGGFVVGLVGFRKAFRPSWGKGRK
ncbi:MAG: hypothetical protein ACPMAQ_09060 [Phycisphaerae bacterium]